MIKKALKIAIAFGVLLAAHLGYVQLFAIVAKRAALSRPQVAALLPTTSRTLKEAIALAGKAFGKEHWTTARDLPGRYYNKERGYWMYYKEYERLDDGKRFRFWPFALIWESRDKKDLKTVTSNEAIIDLDQPLGLRAKPNSEPLRVVHAQINGDVHLRDDRGTDDPGDDLLIGPLPHLAYDEPTLQVRTDDPSTEVVIQDREMWVKGYGLLIQLRPKDETDPTAGSGGFNGAKTAYLKKNVDVILKDGGRSGILPGKARPGQTVDGRTPVHLHCDGEMQIDLPKPKLPIRVGPPAPPSPTFALFSLNVVVLRGRPKQEELPDQLNCDHLRLTLLPGDKTPSAGAETETEAVADSDAQPDPGDGSPDDTFGGLTLRRAVATGHYVWLQSVSQGTKALGNEMIYKKLAPEAPDETYLRADPTSKLWIEKLDIAREGPDQGKITSITNIRTVDATIFDDGQGGDPSRIISYGPGILETRPARDQPVERRTIWKDKFDMVNEKGTDAVLRKRITLTGDPKFIDVKQATLDSKNEIIVWLKPKPAPANPTATASTTTTTTASGTSPAEPDSKDYEIEKLRAIDDVHLYAPGRTMTARHVLVAVFEPQKSPVPAKPTTTATAPTAVPSSDTTASAGATGGPAPAASDAPTAATPSEAKPAEPDVTVWADNVWARIALRPKAEQGQGQGSVAINSNGNGTSERRGAEGMQSEVQEARLRGTVAFHQDPAPGKTRGTNVRGEAIDLLNLGDGKMYFKIFRVDPLKYLSLDEMKKLQPNQLLARLEALVSQSVPLARVETDDFTVEGPIIGLDQKTDEAWVDGHGTLVQFAPRGLLSDKGLDAPNTKTDKKPAQAQSKGKAQPDANANQSPLKIAWFHAMHFKGESRNPQGVPVGRAQFYGDIRAENDESHILCQEMTVYMDRIVHLIRPKKDDKAAANQDRNSDRAPEPDPKPQIALIDCLHKVQVENRKYDPETPTLLQEKQIIEGEHVVYDKLSGNFLAMPPQDRPGMVYLYNREGQDPLTNPNPAQAAPVPATTAERRPIRPTANPTSGPAANTRRATAVVDRNGNAVAQGNGAGAASAKAKEKAKGKSKAEAAAAKPSKPQVPPKLKLTQIEFNDEMHGRFGTGKDGDTTETRWSNFFGDVQVLNSEVASDSVKFNYDDPPREGTFLTAQVVRVVSEPPPGGKGPARNFLWAWENAQAETIDTTIQADRIRYDSSKELFFAYGDEGREVAIAHSKIVGQPASTNHGNAAWYNRRTGAAEIVNPSSIQFVDDKYGVRPGLAVAQDTPEPRKKPLLPVRPPGRSYYERKGFNSGK